MQYAKTQQNSQGSNQGDSEDRCPLCGATRRNTQEANQSPAPTAPQSPISDIEDFAIVTRERCGENSVRNHEPKGGISHPIPKRIFIPQHRSRKTFYKGTGQVVNHQK